MLHSPQLMMKITMLIIMVHSPQGSTVVQQGLEVAGRTWAVTCVSMGNPHALIYSVDGQPIKVRARGRVIVTFHFSIPVGTQLSLGVTGSVASFPGPGTRKGYAGSRGDAGVRDGTPWGGVYTA
jgi:hypothetical protein